MTATRSAMALFFCAATALALSAEDGKEFYGIFNGKAFDGTRDMQWKFLRNKDGITISATIKDAKDPKAKKGSKNLALGSGHDIKVQGNTLEFTMQWAQSQPIKGPKDAKYVAEIKGDMLIVKWTAGDEKGELQAKNANPQVAKKDKKDDKKEPAASEGKAYLSGLTDDKKIPIKKGTVTQLALVQVMGNASKAEWLKVTKDTKFVVVDGDEKKTYDQKTVLDDEATRAAFHERYVTLERKGNVAVTVTATAVKKK
jgi:hypothetical protein